MIYKTATSSLSVHDYLSPLIVAVSLVLPRSLAVFVSCDILLALLYIAESILGIESKLWPPSQL